MGSIAFTRYRGYPAFDNPNLADLSALCLHLSTRLAELRSQPVSITSLDRRKLCQTSAEADISQVVSFVTG